MKQTICQKNKEIKEPQDCIESISDMYENKLLAARKDVSDLKEAQSAELSEIYAKVVQWLFVNDNGFKNVATWRVAFLNHLVLVLFNRYPGKYGGNRVYFDNMHNEVIAQMNKEIRG